MKLVILTCVAGIGLVSTVAADWKKVAGEWDAYRLNDSQRMWFKDVRSSSGVSCCDMADGHPTAMEHRVDGYYIPDPRDSTQPWLKVPDEALQGRKLIP
jgi:hypothetical protein